MVVFCRLGNIPAYCGILAKFSIIKEISSGLKPEPAFFYGIEAAVKKPEFMYRFLAPGGGFWSGIRSAESCKSVSKP
jgi:hypothetical protein